MEVNHYIKRVGVDEDYIDMEKYFNGLRYSKCVGLEELGKPKNLYTETYADADMLRVFLPDKITREATKVTFTFAFLGNSKQRQDVYDRFNKFLENQKISYYDTARKKLIREMVLLEASKPKDDVYKGQGYMTAEYTFQNLYGECERMQ